MEESHKSTGIQASNGMMHVGDGWLCFVAKIVEVEGKIGFFFDDEFMELSDFLYFPGEDIPGLDFEILPEDHGEWYGIHAPLPYDNIEMRGKAMMNNKERLQPIYSGVRPGWWHILDTCIPKILALDPDASFEVKEKFGTLRIWAGSAEKDLSAFDELIQAAEKASETVCVYCGQPGQLRSDRRWKQTLCDRCDCADNGMKAIAIETAEQCWLKTRY